MSIFGDDTTSTSGSMTAMTEPAGRKDETFYWSDSVEFLVEDVRFRVPQYPFHVGSKYFVEKYGLSPDMDHNDGEGAVELKDVTAAQFQVFLKLLFPMHLTSTTTTFPVENWLTILTLSTLWHFHEARKLAIDHIHAAGTLTELDLISVGRAAYVTSWVLAGYKAIVGRPRADGISDEDANTIGLQATHHLWAIRYQIVVSNEDGSDESTEGELLSKFSDEFTALKELELEHRTKAEVERDEREAEEKRLLEEQKKAAAEKEEMERMEAKRKAVEEAAMKQETERRLQRIRRAEEAAKAKAKEELLKKRERLEMNRLDGERKREEETQMEKARLEQIRIEEEKIQKELAALEQQEQETRYQGGRVGLWGGPRSQGLGNVKREIRPPAVPFGESLGWLLKEDPADLSPPVLMPFAQPNDERGDSAMAAIPATDLDEAQSARMLAKSRKRMKKEKRHAGKETQEPELALAPSTSALSDLPDTEPPRADHWLKELF